MGYGAKVVWVLVLAALAAACSSTPPTITPAAPTEDAGATATTLAGAEPVTIEVLNDDIAVGFERIAFRITDASGSPISTSADVESVFNRVSEVSADQQLAQRVASGNALYFGEDLASGGNWVVYNDFDASGPWWLEVTTRSGDWTGQGRAEVDVAARSAMPVKGEKAPDADTPKVGPETPLAALTSDPNPDEALYAASLADATAAGRTAVVLFASPMHCEGETCAETLEQLKSVQGMLGSQATFIHVESRDPSDPNRPSPMAEAWGIAGEPWTFIFDGRGYLGARVQGLIGATELKLLTENVMQ